MTERLELREIDITAVELLATIFAKTEVWRYPLGRGMTRAETNAFVESQIEHWETLGFGLWLAIERKSSETVGYVGLAVPTFFPDVLPAVEVGWRFDPQVWGRGYATEAAHAALAGAFETLQLHEVISLPQTGNLPSVRVAEKIGLRLRRTATAPSTDKRGPVEVAVMVTTREEWLTRNRAEHGPLPSGPSTRSWSPATPARGNQP